MNAEALLFPGKPGPPAATLVDAGQAAHDPALRAAWNDLIAHAAEPNAFAEPWFWSASLHLPQMAGARLAAVWGEDRLLGLLPLTIARRYGRLPVATVQTLLHYHNFLGTPLVRAGQEARFWGAILDLLDRADWACGFLHLPALAEGGPVHRGLIAAAAARGRPCDTVHRIERALLESELTPHAYYERTIRKKKRKELKRLAERLGELGVVEHRLFGPADNLAAWTDAFLALEASGWKGRAGSALRNDPATARFFRDALAGAAAAGRLELRRIDLDGRPIAMLVSFLTPPGAFSFKIAFDEDHARFSPGVLVQLDNLAILARGGIRWSDSCAVEDHPMINSLWTARRSLVRVSVPLAGARRRLTFALCRAAERLAARRRERRPSSSQEPAHDD